MSGIRCVLTNQSNLADTIVAYLPALPDVNDLVLCEGRRFRVWRRNYIEEGEVGLLGYFYAEGEESR